MNFQKINLNNLLNLKDIIYSVDTLNACYSLGIIFMWSDYLNHEFYFDKETLIIKVNYDKESFFLPFKNIEYGLVLINEYAIKNLKNNLTFVELSIENVMFLSKIYPHHKYYFIRDWSDYIYSNEDFKNFSGKKYASKRHHISRFKKLYSEAVFKVSTSEDKNRLLDCINKFINSKHEDDYEFNYEEKASIEMIKNFDKLGFYAFHIELNGEIIAFSICEIKNNMIIDHVEKALKEYDGVYPYLVNSVANYFKDIKYFNREDDSGVSGLRYSKEEYHPKMMIDKYYFEVLNNLDLINKIPTIKVNTDILIKELEKEDKEKYKNLVIDDEYNKYWGYDYKTDLKENKPTGDYFCNSLIDDINNKESFSFMIYYKNNFAGEIVLYNLDNDNSCEIGYRLVKQYTKLGIMSSSLKVFINYLFKDLKISKLRVKAYKENTPSINIINLLNFTYLRSDDIFNYYELINN